MNKIIVSDDRYGNSSYKTCKFSPWDYKIGEIVEIQEGKSSRLAVLVKRHTDFLRSDNGCGICVFRNPDFRKTAPCSCTTNAGFFPCVALFNSKASIAFKPVDTILEDL